MIKSLFFSPLCFLPLSSKKEGVCHFCRKGYVFTGKKTTDKHAHSRKSVSEQTRRTFSTTFSTFVGAVFRRYTVFLQPPRAMKTTTTCFCIVLVMMSGGVWRPTTTSSRGGFFLLGAEAAELEIGYAGFGLTYTVADNSTIVSTEKIGPYYLAYHAQHIINEFAEPPSVNDWDDYLQDFESYMDEFCEVPGGDDWNKFKDYEFTPSNGGTRVASDKFMTKYLTETITAAKAGTAPADGALEKVEKTVKDMCGIHAVLRYLHGGFSDGTNDVNNDTNWDIAAAVYYGQVMRGSLFDRSNYLGREFGTISGVNSATNIKINDAFQKGKQSTSTTTKRQQYEIIEHQMRIVYAQGIIKYALQMDNAIAEKTATAYMEAQAEGQAFARILAPWVGGDNATALEAMFDTSKVPRGYAHYNYCAAKAILQSDINGGISDEEIGTYDHMDEIICPTIDAHMSNLQRSGTDTYTPQSIVGPDLSVSQAVSQVKTLLGDSSDYATIKETYTELGLRALADTDHTGEPVWNIFKAHFGSATWISDFVDLICDGTTLSSHPGARAELLEKTVMDALQVQAIISDLYQGYSNDDQDKWDQGAAKFHGAGDSYDSTVFARGDKRGANYNTLFGNVAKANKNIATALASGNTVANYETVLKNIKIIYAQATIRYAWLIDRDVVEGTDYREHQAEGLAFFRVIAPWVKPSSGYDTVSQIFDTTKRPFSVIGHSYCLVEQIITNALDISTADLGNLEDASSLASCSNVATSKVISEGDTTLFTATTDIGASLETSNLVSDVKAILDVTSPNFAAIKAKYRSDGLRGMADADRSGEPAYNLFYAYYASKTWISDFLYRATDGTATSNSEPARLEAVEKTMWDATMVNAIASDLYRGISDKNAWDAAAAKYFGKATTRSTTIYGRANKRAANFGTLSSDGVTAKVNAAISAAFKSGQSQNNHDIILKSIKTIYAQCAVRYGLMLDQDVASGADYREHQAEGWAFWRVLAPWVSEVDSSGAQVLDYMFNTATTPNHANHYCFAVNVVKNLNIAADDMGVHEGAPSLDSCVGIEPTIIGATPSSGFTHFAAKSMFFVYFAATFLVASLALCAL